MNKIKFHKKENVITVMSPEDLMIIEDLNDSYTEYVYLFGLFSRRFFTNPA